MYKETLQRLFIDSVKRDKRRRWKLTKEYTNFWYQKSLLECEMTYAQSIFTEIQILGLFWVWQYPMIIPKEEAIS